MSRTAARSIAIVLGMLLLTAAITCESNHLKAPRRPAPSNGRIAAAHAFTRRYAQSRFSGWNIRAEAAGADCDVLFVNTSVILEESMIEAMQYGAGAYDVYEGGVQHFYREQSFRGVAYRDGSERIWTYGAVSVAEAEGMSACRKGFM
jgi:hypothetical protein